MSMSVGASSSNASSYLQQLLQQGKPKSSDASKATDPLSMLMQAISGGDGSASGQAGSATGTSLATSTGSSNPAFGSDTMAALISAQGQQTNGSAESKFFAKLDSNGDGQISQSEFSAAASKAGADSGIANAVFAKIDSNGDGSISQNELTKADHGGHHHIGGGAPPSDSGGSGSTAGATTTTTTNADGSTTTTISYADGSKIDMTTPATSSSGSGSDSDGDGDGSGGSSGQSSFSKSASNMLEQLIKLQSQMLNVASSTLSAVA